MTQELIPEDYARTIAREYKRVIPETTQAFYFLDPETKAIRVLILNPQVESSPEIVSHDFPLTGRDLIVSLCIITPEQWDEILSGQIFLPENWLDFQPLEF